MPQHASFEGCQVMLDDRYAPLVISIWRGQATLEAAKWHDGMNRSAAATMADRFGGVVTVADASAATRPAPEVRKFWADGMEADATPMTDQNVATYVVMTSAMMRGVMTALGWVNERARQMRTVASIEAAIDGALGALDEAGIPRPDGLTGQTYVPPPFPEDVASNET